MFDNAGEKLKEVAVVICFLGIIGSIIGGIYLGIDLAKADQATRGILLGALIAVLGSLFSWIEALVLHAIGEAAENSAIIAEKLAPEEFEDD